MVNWQVLSQHIGAQPIQATSTTKKHQLGDRVQAYDADYGIGEFIYLQGVASCEQYDWCTLPSDNHVAVRLAANAIGPCGIAMAAITASYYGWFQIYGKAIGQCLTQLADNARLWITATAGAVDDASVAGDLITGARAASATVADSGVADFELEYPYTDNNTSFT